MSNECLLDESQHERRQEDERAGERNAPPLMDQWPDLRFLGMGAWWAWIWLCYGSVEIVSLFPEELRSRLIFFMYLLSTMSIAATMVSAAFAWKRVSRQLDRRGVIFGFSAVAAVATLFLGYSAIVGTPFFIVGTLATGVGTAGLCLKAGRLYGSIPLGESLTAGGLSLVFAAFLYFVGVGIPAEGRLFFIAALPLLAAALLNMRSDEQFPAADGIEERNGTANKAERHIYHRLVAASAIVAFTAGVGKGISSTGGTAGSFADEGAVISLIAGLIGVAIVIVVNRSSVRRGARQVYSALMVAGIAMMLATCFGFNIAYLSIGKESLWMVLSCFLAYVSFRYDLSPIRTFGFGQAAYFVGSTAGWAVGYALCPYYNDGTVLLGTGMVLAVMVLLVLVYVFPEWMVKRITDASRDSVPFHSRYRQLVSAAERIKPMEAAGQQAGTVEVEGVHVGSVDAVQAGSVGGVGAVRAGSCYDEDSSEAGVAVGVPRVPAAHPDSAEFEGASAPVQSSNAVVRGLERAALPAYGLSARELEVLDLFSQGRSASWIADYLVISKNTVRSHLRSIYTKLDVHTRQELLDFLEGKDATVE